jgi:hypothetical protein
VSSITGGIEEHGLPNAVTPVKIPLTTTLVTPNESVAVTFTGTELPVAQEPSTGFVIDTTGGGGTNEIGHVGSEGTVVVVVVVVGGSTITGRVRLWLAPNGSTALPVKL